MTDDDVIVAITKVKGLGRWSADMFLMFRLNRPDVLPVGDLGIVRAMQRCYGLRKPPTPERMVKIAEVLAAVPLNRVLVSVEESRE